MTSLFTGSGPRPRRPGRSRGKGGLRRFLADTRGAVGITSALLTMMFLGGAALMTDRLWVIDNRDTLKNATDGATLAVTRKLAELPPGMSDAAAEVELESMAERYVRLNLLQNLPVAARAAAADSLAVEADVDRGSGRVDLTVEAGLDESFLLTTLFFGYDGSGASVRQTSRVEATIATTELVFAIDATQSMKNDLFGATAPSDADRRLEIVRRAALELVDLLASRGVEGGGAPLAVGLVPWTYRVRLDAATRSRWESEGWAIYPTERDYPHPPPGKGPATYAHPERQLLPGRDELPSQCRAWKGCIDHRALRSADGSVPPAFTTAHPGDAPFTMNFFTSQTNQPDLHYVSYGCQAYDRSDGTGWEKPLCYDLSMASSESAKCWLTGEDIGPDGPKRVDPQDGCRSQTVNPVLQPLTPEILPLTSDLDVVRDRITNLGAPGRTTYSAAGVSWGMRLLAPSWRDAWGDPVYPMPSTGARPVRKVLILLTDGEDNHYTDAESHRQQACSEAKAAGIRLFVITAMDPGSVGTELAAQLEQCSSQADDPEGRYVFFNNATPEHLEEAFREIGRQLLVMRRVH